MNNWQNKPYNYHQKRTENLENKNKENATKNCNKANIKCKFIYENNIQEYNIVTKQSMRSGSNVPINTTVTLTLGK